MNTRHKLHWQCGDAPVSSWHSVSCRRNLASHPATISHMRCCKTSYGGSILLHTLATHLSLRNPVCVFQLAVPRLHRQTYCKISGRVHVLLDGWDVLCTSLTEWLLQRTQVAVRGECYVHGTDLLPDLHVLLTLTIPDPKDLLFFNGYVTSWLDQDGRWKGHETR